MQVKINESWLPYLHQEFEKEYFKKLLDFVENQYQKEVCYPKRSQIFASLDFCPFETVKIVIIGQDPYHGANQANGLCFSVNDNQKIPPSLKNIFTEIESDLGLPFPTNGNLERWAKQGVLLLNSILTVRENSPDSHQKKGWETFTNKIIQSISQKKEKVVFMLWGNYAQQKGVMIDANKHKILRAAHPSPFSVYRGFFGCKHFSQANAYLESTHQTPIVW